jgi:hypothetical protein
VRRLDAGGEGRDGCGPPSGAHGTGAAPLRLKEARCSRGTGNGTWRPRAAEEMQGRGRLGGCRATATVVFAAAAGVRGKVRASFTRGKARLSGTQSAARV